MQKLLIGSGLTIILVILAAIFPQIAVMFTAIIIVGLFVIFK